MSIWNKIKMFFMNMFSNPQETKKKKKTVNNKYILTKVNKK